MPKLEVIDSITFNTLLDSLGGDTDFLNELVEAYLSTTPGILNDMHTALAAGDAPGLQRAAHSLKSGSASLGALLFAAQCKELEESSRQGKLEHADDKIQKIEAAYVLVAAALQEKLQNLGATASG